MNAKEIKKTINEVKAECAALVEVEKAARAMVEFCYTTPSGKPGWRGEVNMHKGISIPASELRDRLAELDEIRRGYGT